MFLTQTNEFYADSDEKARNAKEKERDQKAPVARRVAKSVPVENIRTQHRGTGKSFL